MNSQCTYPNALPPVLSHARHIITSNRHDRSVGGSPENVYYLRLESEILISNLNIGPDGPESINISDFQFISLYERYCLVSGGMNDH